MKNRSTSERKRAAGGRELKRRVLEALETGGEETAIQALGGIPLKQLVSPLFGALHRMEPRVHWTAVKVMGAVTAGLAREDMEEARVVLRRMMWNLNDESGGIGWGVPEAMAEILTRNEALAREFVNILASYSREEANYLEHEPLQHGLLWGMVRLALVRPELLRGAKPEVGPFLRSGSPVLRGLGAYLSGLLRLDGLRADLEELARDEAVIREDLDGILPADRVGDLAVLALDELDRRGGGLRDRKEKSGLDPP